MIDTKDCWLTDCQKADCGAFCLQLFKLNYLYNEANISMQQRKYLPLRIDADGSDRDAFILLGEKQKDIINFVKKGENLYLYSYNCGCGKTSWALRLVQTYFNKIWPSCNLECKALFINVPRFMLELKDSLNHDNEYIKHIKENILTTDIVIWDDIATKSTTSFEAENLFSIIDTRITSGKSNIYTSNISCDELETLLGSRLTSRIINNSTVIEFIGKDKRGIWSTK